MQILPVQMALPSRKQGEAATGILNSLVTRQEIQEDGQLRGATLSPDRQDGSTLSCTRYLHNI